MAILKAVTLGGLYLWALFDLFVIYKAAQEKNIAIIWGIHSTLVQSR